MPYENTEARPTFWRRKWQPTPVFLPGEFYEQTSLVGYSPWDREQSGMSEQLSLIQPFKLFIGTFIKQMNQF